MPRCRVKPCRTYFAEWQSVVSYTFAWTTALRKVRNSLGNFNSACYFAYATRRDCLVGIPAEAPKLWNDKILSELAGLVISRLFLFLHLSSEEQTGCPPDQPAPASSHQVCQVSNSAHTLVKIFSSISHPTPLKKIPQSLFKAIRFWCPLIPKYLLVRM